MIKVQYPIYANGRSLNGALPTYTGRVPRDFKAVDSPCLTFNGTDQSISVSSLTGSETVVSSGGTSTPSISAGQIDFTAGTCWDLRLSNGMIIPMSNKGMGGVYDTFNKAFYPITTYAASMWNGTQDSYHEHLNNGCDIALDFDGIDDVVSLTSDTNLAGDFKISFGINFGVMPTGDNGIFSSANTANAFILRSNTIAVKINGSWHTDVAPALSANTNYQIEVIRTGTLLTVKVDGSVHKILTVNSATFTINRIGRYSSHEVNALLWDFVVEDNGAEVFNSRFIDGGSSTQVTDDSVNGDHGTINGATYVEIPANADGTSPLGRSALSNPAGKLNTHTTKLVEQEPDAPDLRGVDLGDFDDSEGGYAINGDSGDFVIGVDSLTGESQIYLPAG